jgi:hypothetical protein
MAEGSCADKTKSNAGIPDSSPSENKPRFSQRKIVFGLFLGISMFIGLLFMVYWVGEKVGFYNQAYLLGIVAPLACSIPTSALLLLFIITAQSCQWAGWVV